MTPLPSWGATLSKIRVTPGWTVVPHFFSELPSTQDVPLDRPPGEQEVHVIVTDHQTRGRGRLDRTWISTSGNFAATFVFRAPARDPQTFFQLSLVSAAALCNSLRPWVDQAQLQLKWPNDILLSGKKLAGLLLSHQGKEIRIGCGMNIVEYPKGVDTALFREPCALLPSLRVPDFVPERWLGDFVNFMIIFWESWTSGDQKLWRRVWEKFGIFNVPTKLRDGREVVPLTIGVLGELVVKSGHDVFSIYSEEIL